MKQILLLAAIYSLVIYQSRKQARTSLQHQSQKVRLSGLTKIPTSTHPDKPTPEEHSDNRTIATLGSVPDAVVSFAVFSLLTTIPAGR